ncbi:LysR substrate-binding domain-containing protein [Microbacterium limosum]|uniref:LysR substrate-binding domain-containing protein n=1 Tax=Microbacterium limosum TaxID=3079935 RepID=A0AAU0MHD7_9MICO|nr:LysR substrate-binding domain-containing protein [Microbacterium sp. Y20]WOQ69432.1 LysR substrate-binding domain-containing protein [Microbacterium sp. Y20]
MLELRRLRLLHELSLRGTIAEVARALGYSSSTVSQQLGLLEREAGAVLLEPDGRRVRLTAEGVRLARHAARVLELDEAARAELRDSGAGESRVRIAVMPTAAQSLVPAALGLLADRGAAVRLEYREMPPEDALFELAARTFDLVVAEQYPGHTRELRAGIDRTSLGTDPIRLALPAEDPAHRLADLAERAWIFEPSGTAVRNWAVQQCRAAGFEPDVRYEATDLTAHIRLVASGHAVAMLPDLVWAQDGGAVRLVDLPGRPEREVFAAARTASRKSPAIAAVLAALKDALAARQQR